MNPSNTNASTPSPLSPNSSSTGTTIETCIFGPQGAPIRPFPFHRDSSTSNGIANTSATTENNVHNSCIHNINHDDNTVTMTPPASPRTNRNSPTLPSRPTKQSSHTTISSSIIDNSNNNNNNNNNITPPQNHIINLQQLRRLTSQGIPDTSTHRALAWRILLGYVPLDTSQWEMTLRRDRSLYKGLVQDLFADSSIQDVDCGYLLIGGYKFKNRQQQQYENDVQEHLPQIEIQLSEFNSNTTITNTIINDTSANTNTTTSVSNNHHHYPTTTTTTTKSTTTTTKPTTSIKIPQHIQEIFEKRGKDASALIEGMTILRTSSSIDSSDSHNNNNDNNKDCKKRFFNQLRIHPIVTSTSSSSSSEEIITTETTTSTMQLPNNNELNSNKNHGNNLNSLESSSLSINNEINSKTPTFNHPTTPSPPEEEEEYNWTQFFENASLLDEIRKDVVRTHPDLQFFLEPELSLGKRRYAALERILFVWSKLNKGVRYVQGMNEIVGTMYYVLANDPNEEWSSEAEADTYFLFNTLMVEMRDIFVPDLDEADTGIQGRMSNMIALLSLHDPDVRCHLDDCGIDPGFYSIRWLTTLLSREFLVPDTIRLWDSMFASTHKDNFMRYVCVTMVMIIRQDLLKGDFSKCLRLLQAYPPTDVDRLLEASRALWIYESQVTLACHKGGITLTQALTTIAPPPAVIMAYGLHGGLAIDHIERMRRETVKKFSRMSRRGENSSISTSEMSMSNSENGPVVAGSSSGLNRNPSITMTRSSSNHSLSAMSLSSSGNKSFFGLFGGNKKK